MSTMRLSIVIYNPRQSPRHLAGVARQSLVAVSVFVCDVICPCVLPLIGAAGETETDNV